MSNIHELELHGAINIKEDIRVMRVPGGWLYNETFVKYNEEFRYSPKKFSLTKDQIINIVSIYYYNSLRLPKDFYLKKTRKPLEVEGKQIMVKLMIDMLTMKQIDIARELKYKERSTITAAKRTIDKKIDRDKRTKNRYLGILREINLIVK